MRILACAFLLAGSICLCAQEEKEKDAPKQHVTTGLELTPPQKFTDVDIAKVRAHVESKEGDTVEVLWMITPSFDPPWKNFKWWEADEGRSVQFVVPNRKGFVQVVAFAVVKGKATSKTPAVTFVDIDYQGKDDEVKFKPLSKPKVEEAPKVKPKEAKAPKVDPKVKVNRLVLVLKDKENADITEMVIGNDLKNALFAKGIGASDYVYMREGDPDAKKYERFVKDAGGPPVVIYITPNGVRRSVQITKDTSAEDIAKGAGE
jgi:hypothetical protein